MTNTAPLAATRSLPLSAESYHVFGLGLGTDDLRYIGWTQRSVDAEPEQILSDLMDSAPAVLAEAIGSGAGRARISLFEIESVATQEQAATSVAGLCVYFNSLGLQVTCGC